MAHVIQTENHQILKKAHLRHVSDDEPGYSRRRCGRGFIYVSTRGERLQCERTLKRLRSLVIPPAWNDVWICRDHKGHLQATGRDKKGRKQYIYHSSWQEVTREIRFNQMIEFARALPTVRRKIRRHLQKKGFGKDKIVACILRILDKGHLRIGNEFYRRENESYGLTTLLKEHVDVKGPAVHFHFRGKKGKWRDVEIDDQRIAQVLSNMKELPGEHLFSYCDSEGEVIDIHSEDVNEVIQEVTGGPWTAKDFRTWWGSVLAFSVLRSQEPEAAKTKRKKQLVETVKFVAEELGNTPAICRKYYIHPKILDEFLSGKSLDTKRQKPVKGLRADEYRLLSFLRG